MRKFSFLLLLNIFLFNNISFASFPVTQNQEFNQVTNVSQDLSEEESFWAKMTTKPEKDDIHIGGLLLGFFLGLIGVGLAYLISKNPSFKRSSLYGFGLWLILLLISGDF